LLLVDSFLFQNTGSKYRFDSRNLFFFKHPQTVVKVQQERPIHCHIFFPLLDKGELLLLNQLRALHSSQFSPSSSHWGATIDVESLVFLPFSAVQCS